METNRKILIGTDYSEAAGKAELYAIQLALKTGFTPVFLHVFEAPLANPMAGFDADKIDQNLHLLERNKLQNHIAGLYQTLNISEDFVKPEFVIREGSAGDQILEESKESHIELIIVGTHGVSGFKEFFIGSHAWDVIKNATVPVLTIPREGNFANIEKLVFATEYRDGELPAIEFLLKFGRFVKAEVQLVHVLNPFITKTIEDLQHKEFNEELKDIYRTDPPEIITLNYDDVAEGLGDYCEKNQVNWLVMSPEIPTLLEKIFVPNVSMTRKMSFLTNIPLLAIPDYFDHGDEEFWTIFDKK